MLRILSSKSSSCVWRSNGSLYVVAVVLSSIASLVAVGQEQASFPSMYPDGEPFLSAIRKERPNEAFVRKVTGIAVPHHLLAADLIARGFWTASNTKFERIILLSPDHFNKSRRPLATTTQDIDTPLGLLVNDREVTTALLEQNSLFDNSDLFRKEHGIAALLPFVKYFFPNARIVPIAVSYSSTRAHWEAVMSALRNFAGPDTLIVQSTDYSHYLPHEIAVRRDQETLNVIAAGDTHALEHLVQPDHMDSKGSQYIQMRLQNEVFGARSTVIANRNSKEYSAMGKQTTSYMVTVYSPEADGDSKLRYDDQEVFYFGGDVFLGRWFAKPLADPTIANALVERIRNVTGGAPLIVNLEGLLLDDPPDVPNDLHVMNASLALPILKSLNVQAVSLANNHSRDLGENGFKESLAIVKRAGIKPLVHMSPASMGRFGVVPVNFIGVLDYKNYPVIKSRAQLRALCRMTARSPLVAFVHWGEEYHRVATAAQYDAAEILHDCGVTAIIGAHSHQASGNIEVLGGGEYQMTYSIGNLLFDQRGDRASTALLELRVFKQGTIATRLIKLPNLFDVATRPKSPSSNPAELQQP